MKTQKRIIALVLFAVMLFSLAACSKNDPTPSTDNTTAPSTTPAGDATTPSTDASASDWAGPDWMNQTGMPIGKAPRRLCPFMWSRLPSTATSRSPGCTSTSPK